MSQSNAAKTIPAETLVQLIEIVGEKNITLEQAALVSGSKDAYHFSPVLLEDLEGKIAEVIVRPESQAQLKAVISLAVNSGIPITPRGGGTGNYGQGVPLEGGILINTKHINQILDISPDYARVECGTILWNIEKAAREVGAELRIFPSTLPTSSTAGFITGGSGGIGSITWGMLSDNENVRALKIVTIEAEPQAIELNTQAAMKDVMHNCGISAIVTEVELALAPKKAWNQFALAFDDMETALLAGEKLAYDESLEKKLLSVFEWPIPSFFAPLVKKEACPEGKALILLMTTATEKELAPYLENTGAVQTFFQPPAEGASRGFQIYDFTWNHTTMWAMKADKNYTYLQDVFDAEQLHSLTKKRKQKYGDQILLHVEFLKSDGQIRPGALSLVYYKGREDLTAIIDYCESIGIRVSNPHTYFLDDDIRWYNPGIVHARKRWDPNGLLNPGHLRDLDPPLAN